MIWYGAVHIDTCNKAIDKGFRPEIITEFMKGISVIISARIELIPLEVPLIARNYVWIFFEGRTIHKERLKNMDDVLLCLVMLCQNILQYAQYIRRAAVHHYEETNLDYRLNEWMEHHHLYWNHIWFSFVVNRDKCTHFEGGTRIFFWGPPTISFP